VALMDSRLFDVDPLTGITRTFHYDHETDTYTIQTEQRVDDLVEQNKSLANEDVGGYGEMTRVASIPLNIYFDLKQQGIIDDPQRLKKWLNDSDNRAFRTKLGYV
jgi:hypothetical protein